MKTTLQRLKFFGFFVSFLRTNCGELVSELPFDTPRNQLAGPLAPQWQGWRQLQVLVQAVETGFVEDHRKRTP